MNLFSIMLAVLGLLYLVSKIFLIEGVRNIYILINKYSNKLELIIGKKPEKEERVTAI